MTLVCLTTILLFSGNQSGSTSGAPMKQQQFAAREAGKVYHDEPASESIDSIDSQPLVSSLKAQQVGSASNSDDGFDDSANFDERRDSPAKTKRKQSDSLGANNTADSKASGPEHEVEETTTGAAGSQLADQQQAADPSPPSLIDPILSQILNDMELGSLFKMIKRASNATGSGVFNKPIVRRSKNGATIIISSSSFNESNLTGDTPTSGGGLPALLERLLPPGLRPLAQLGANGSSPFGGGIGTATITIGAEPIFAGSSSSSSRLGPAAAGFGSVDPFGGFPPGHRFAPASPFMEPMMGFRFPAPFMGAGFGQPAMGPPPSLMSMLMRQATSGDADDELLAPAFASGPITRSYFVGPLMGGMAADPDRAAGGKLDRISSNSNNNTQASHNSTANTIKLAESAPDASIASEGKPKEPAHKLMHNLYSASAAKKPLSSGSMLVFSSGALEPASRDPFQFQLAPALSSFMSVPPMPPVMMFGGSGEPHSMSSGSSPLNPILRSILNSVRSDLDERNKTERNKINQRASGSTWTPHWTSSSSASSSASSSSPAPPTSGDMMDDEWNGSASEFDEQLGAKQMRARHRSADDDGDAGSLAAATTLDGPDFQLESNISPLAAMDRSPMESSGGIVSGTIRQTIRGPGMTVERIIEVPSGRLHTPTGQQARSQSRADMMEDNNDDTPFVPNRSSSGPLFSRSASDRMATSGGFEDFAMPHVGFIGRLLSDMSRRVSAEREHHEQGALERAFPMASFLNNGRSLNNDDESSDESDESDSKENHLAKAADKSNQHQHLATRHWTLRRPKPSRADAGAFSVWPELLFRAPHDTGLNDISAGEQAQTREFKALPSHQISSFQLEEPVGKSSGGGSFEDTMNTMENRLNHVLAQNGFSTSGNNNKPLASEEIGGSSNRSAGGRTGGSGDGLPVASQTSPSLGLAMIGRMDPKQATSGSSHHAGQVQVQAARQLGSQPSVYVGNPFTSPSSPLFGFPASSMSAGGGSAQAAAAAAAAAVAGSQLLSSPDKDQKSAKLGNPTSNYAPAAPSDIPHLSNSNNNRKQRSFTYHSNNELASAVSQKQQQQQQQQLGVSESVSRPRFMAPFVAPPANIVMGRRLDDRPNLSETMQMAAMDHQPFEKQTSAFDGRNLINSNPNFSNNQAAENYRTIVV